MSNTTAIGKERLLEMTWNTGGEEEVAAAQESAMASAIFERLQARGMIDPQATLHTELTSGDLEGKTYAEALQELIGDRDLDQHLDLDVYALVYSGVTLPSALPDKIETAVANQFHPGLNHTFLMKQGLYSDFGLNERGEANAALTRGLYLEDSLAQRNAALIGKLGAQIENGHGDRAAGEVLARAQLETHLGRDGEARKLLLGAGDQFLAAGDDKNAKRIFEELTREPHAAAKLNAVQHHVDPLLAAGDTFGDKNTVVFENAHGKVSIFPASHETAFGVVAERRLTQLAFKDKMSAALGRAADPRSSADAKQYFDQFSKKASTEEVQKELGSYLSSFYAHSGEGASWTKIPEDGRSKELDTLFADQPLDASGRKLIDCEGFAYLAGGLLDEKRFDVRYLQRPGHIIAGVIDKKTDQLFTVNNAATRMVPGKAVDGNATRSQLATMAAEAGTTRDQGDSFFGWGKTPSAAYMKQNDGAPRAGTFALGKDGQIAGIFDEESIARYRELMKKPRH